jgi:glycosyltransferase involved in cell wall biosynthesis
MAGNGAGGQDRYERVVSKRLSGLGRRLRVEWLGWLSTQEMPAAFAASDIAILPSLVEATSLAGLEAMSSGCALIGTRVGGIPEMIESGRTGVLVEPANPDALLGAWADLLRDANKIRMFGAAATKIATERFSWAAVTSQTERVYEQALSDCGRNRVEPAHANS